MLRGQHALQLIAGAVLGIGAGAGVKAVAGSASGRCGAVAIAVAVVAALIVALAVGGGFSGRGVLFVNRATTSAILMIAVAGAATGSERLSAALIGGGVTLVITVIMFPAAPLPLIQDAVQQVFAALRDTLAHLAGLAGLGQEAGPDWALAAGPHHWAAHTGPAGPAPGGPVGRRSGREPRAAPLARPVPGPPGRGTGRTAPSGRCHRAEPGPGSIPRPGSRIVQPCATLPASLSRRSPPWLKEGTPRLPRRPGTPSGSGPC